MTQDSPTITLAPDSPAGPSPTAPRRRRRRSPLRNLAFGLFTAVLALLLLEMAARVLQTIHDDRTAALKSWFKLDPALGWKLRPHFAGNMFSAYRQVDARGFLSLDTPKLADAQNPKILAIGDSCTFGVSTQTSETFPAVLDALLPGAHVINMGVPGYTSLQGCRRLLDQGLDLKPAAVIIAFNYNDRRYVVPPLQPDNAAGFRHTWRQNQAHNLNHYIYILRCFNQFALQRATATQPDVEDWAEQDAPRTDPPLTLETLQPRVAPQDYGRNLTRMAEAARARGIPVIFLALGDNPAEMAGVEEAAALLESGNAQAAADRLSPPHAEPGNLSPLGRRLQAQAWRKLGLEAAASRTAKIDKLRISAMGGTPVVTAGALNKIMRDVAAAQGASCVDATRVLGRHPELFIDICHYKPAGYRMIAELLRDEIAKLKIGG